MKYYMVKPEYDNRKLYRYAKNPNSLEFLGEILIGGELFTPTERKKIANSDQCFELVEVSRKQTYWFFGGRFSGKTGGYHHD